MKTQTKKQSKKDINQIIAVPLLGSFDEWISRTGWKPGPAFLDNPEEDPLYPSLVRFPELVWDYQGKLVVTLVKFSHETSLSAVKVYLHAKNLVPAPLSLLFGLALVLEREQLEKHHYVAPNELGSPKDPQVYRLRLRKDYQRIDITREGFTFPADATFPVHCIFACISA